MERCQCGIKWSVTIKKDKDSHLVPHLFTAARAKVSDKVRQRYVGVRDSEVAALKKAGLSVTDCFRRGLETLTSTADGSIIQHDDISLLYKP
jgi:hypothetical protein